MFDEDFRVCFADTPFGVALHQRIRYQVFCLDKGFEDPSAFSTSRETDAWDDHSAHFIVQNKKSQQWVAATRLVLPKPGSPLPVDTLGAFERDRLEDPGLQVAEISRFCFCCSLTQSRIAPAHPSSTMAGSRPLRVSQPPAALSPFVVKIWS